MNYLRMTELNKRFDQFTSEKLQSQLPILKYKYRCRNLGCSRTIQSLVALSRDYHFCLHCIK